MKLLVSVLSHFFTFKYTQNIEYRYSCPSPGKSEEDHQESGNRLTKSLAYLIRDYSFDVWVYFDACFFIRLLLGNLLYTEQLPCFHESQRIVKV